MVLSSPRQVVNERPSWTPWGGTRDGRKNKSAAIRVAPDLSSGTQAHVVGVPDQSKGEIVAAVIELRAGAACDAASIIAFCRERLASYKVPVRLQIRFAAEFPRTATGKIHKPKLRQELAADTGARIWPCRPAAPKTVEC
jgi:acyl-CoA synthetase (AMP-forming)/AMP-acid ligase II